MPLSQRLAAAEPRSSNRGCRTCQWLETLSDSDKQSILDWLSRGWAVSQLYRLCNTEPENPLQVSYTAFLNHTRDCIR